MAKQLRAKTKVETPKAVKAKPTALGDINDELGTALVPMPKSTALSLDVGLAALRDYASAEHDEAQIEQLRDTNNKRRGRAQVSLAMAYYRAALADKSINLADSLLPIKGNKPAKDKLGAQLRLVVGLAEKQGEKTVWTQAARDIMMGSPDDDEAMAKRKKSIRVNFSTLMMKSAQVALKAIEAGAKLETDKETGLARLTDGKKGGWVGSHFGAASVLLNEDQNAKVLDKKGNLTTVKLKALPSFTEIQRAVAKDHGKVMKPKGDGRVGGLVDPTKDMIARCGYMVQALEKMPDEIPADLRKALESLQNAISEALGE